MDVTIRNGDGKIIGTTQTVDLDSSDAAAAGLDTDVDDPGTGICAVGWTTSVPANEKFYAVQIGRRGELSYSHDEMESRSWLLQASLGN